MTPVVQIITGGLGALGFALLYNIRGRRLAAAALGGLISWAIFLLLGIFDLSEPLRYFIVSVAISLYSEIMARILRTPTTTFIITSLIPLIPGGSLYYTMTAALGGQPEDFIKNGLVTLQLGAALALGIVIVSLFGRHRGNRYGRGPHSHRVRCKTR